MAKKTSGHHRLPRSVLIEAARIFGRQGGKARVARQSPEQRRESARKAAQARWARAKAKKNTQQDSLGCVWSFNLRPGYLTSIRSCTAASAILHRDMPQG